MTTALLIQYLSSIISLGLGCGACCSPYISIILSSYTLAHGNNIKKSVKVFFSFFLGKWLSILFVCIFSLIIGQKLISDEGYIWKINVNYLLQIVLLIIGIYLTVQWIIKKRNSSKCSKRKCSEQSLDKSNRLKKWPVFCVGFFYGITPCPPMILLMGYALVVPIEWIIILITVFTIVTAMSPILFSVLISGFLSKKMYADIPKYIDVIKLICYLIMIAISVIMFFY